MSQIAQVSQTLKQLLRQKQFTYKDVAKALDMSEANVVSKFCSDMGETWGPMHILTPRAGHSHGADEDHHRRQQ